MSWVQTPLGRDSDFFPSLFMYVSTISLNINNPHTATAAIIIIIIIMIIIAAENRFEEFQEPAPLTFN